MKNLLRVVLVVILLSVLLPSVASAQDECTITTTDGAVFTLPYGGQVTYDGHTYACSSATGGDSGSSNDDEVTPTAVPQGNSDVGVNFEISGAPASVELSTDELAILVSDEQMAHRDPTKNFNSLGLNTEFVLGDAGTYLTFDEADDRKNDSAWLVSPDTQYLLSYEEPAWANLSEGSCIWLTAAEVTAEVESVLSEFKVNVFAEEGHSWFVVLCNKHWDHKIDTDLNLEVTVTDYNPGFIQVNRFPPGKFLSQEHFLDNVASAHCQKSSGSDGSSSVSALILDVNIGAWVVITQDQPVEDCDFTDLASTEGWELVDTNIAN